MCCACDSFAHCLQGLLLVSYDERCNVTRNVWLVRSPANAASPDWNHGGRLRLRQQEIALKGLRQKRNINIHTINIDIQIFNIETHILHISTHTFNINMNILILIFIFLTLKTLKLAFLVSGPYACFHIDNIALHYTANWQVS